MAPFVGLFRCQVSGFRCHGIGDSIAPLSQRKALTAPPKGGAKRVRCMGKDCPSQSPEGDSSPQGESQGVRWRTAHHPALTRLFCLKTYPRYVFRGGKSPSRGRQGLAFCGRFVNRPYIFFVGPLGAARAVFWFSACRLSDLFKMDCRAIGTA